MDPGGGQPSLRVFPDGYVAYARHDYEVAVPTTVGSYNGYVAYARHDYDYHLRLRDELPGDQAALAAAADWLIRAGLAQAEKLGPGAVDADLEIGLLLVRFRPNQPEDIVTLAPWAQVELGAGGVVVAGQAVWFGQGESDNYPLRTVPEAWQDVIAGKASLWWEATEYLGPSDPWGVVRGNVTITDIRVATALARSEDSTLYLVPVYAFGGTAQVADGAGGFELLPVLAWVSAVAPLYQAP